MIAALLLAAASPPAATPWVSRDGGAIGQLLSQSAGTCRSPGVRVAGERAVGAAFYDNMTGFARTAGTTGGLGRRVFLVDRTDDPHGPAPRGSLRWAVAQSAAAGGWIAFAPALSGRTITLAAPLRLESDITIDGGCAMPRLTGAGRGSLLYLQGSRNIVIARLQLEQSGAGGVGDCVTVSHGADRIWLGFLRIRRCRDGLIDVTRDGVAGPMRVTVSNNRFSDHDKAMLIVGAPLSPPCSLSRDPVRVTVARNIFYHTGQRHPRARGDAFVQVQDNVIAFAPRPRANGALGGAYGTLAAEGAHIVVERTLYAVPGGQRNFRLVAAQAGRSEAGSATCGQGEVEWKRDASPGGDAERLAFVRSIIRQTNAAP